MSGNGIDMPSSSFENLDQGQKELESSNEFSSKIWEDIDHPLNYNETQESENIKDPGCVNSDLWEKIDQPLDYENLLEDNEVGDDNGRPYMRDGERIPNNEYDLNGYHYTTDEQGRIIRVEGNIHIPENKEPRRSNLPDIKDTKETDDKGHVIAHEFGGADNEGNLVPMDAELNRHGDYRKCEREIGQATRDGKDVNVTVECEYGENARPTSFTVIIEIDGEISERTFLNK